MYVAVLPRKVVGVIFCLIGAMVMIMGILGASSGNGGPVISVIIGSFFAGVGWLAIKSSTRKPGTSLAASRTLPMSQPASKPSGPSAPAATARRSGRWTRTLPTRSGWYWYRSTWEGEQDDPELIHCNASDPQSGETEFLTAAGYNLFPEDFAKMKTEFWTELVVPPPTR